MASTCSTVKDKAPELKFVTPYEAGSAPEKLTEPESITFARNVTLAGLYKFRNELVVSILLAWMYSQLG